jgi:lipopolysaccharide transport system ATP-binding protein
MGAIAIRANAISKQYRLGGYEAGVETLRDRIVHAASRSIATARSALNGRSNGREPSSEPRYLWALQNLSFEVRRGEVMGIIGPNGAGKSTLLRILSRITEPTSGYADIHGRVGSLLEVGLGFHGELTGRENVYFVGAMLGMRKSEIQRKFDEIVEFSEVERFIDTPTKRYSTGMHMRLAFAVAVHLEPDILLVDEALAVGDLSFQRKCLRKMESVAAQGRTVLFVSHNLAAMQELCETAVVLVDGQLTFRGPIADGISCYGEQVMLDGSKAPLRTEGTHWSQVTINGSRRGVVVTTPGGNPFFVEGTFELATPAHRGRFLCSLENARGEIVLDQCVENDALGATLLPAGEHRLRVDFPSMWLAPGIYTLYFRFTGSDLGDIFWSPAAMINIQGGLGVAGGGILNAPLEWQLTSTPCDTRELVS